MDKLTQVPRGHTIQASPRKHAKTQQQQDLEGLSSKTSRVQDAGGVPQRADKSSFGQVVRWPIGAILLLNGATLLAQFTSQPPNTYTNSTVQGERGKTDQ